MMKKSERLSTDHDVNYMLVTFHTIRGSRWTSGSRVSSGTAPLQTTPGWHQHQISISITIIIVIVIVIIIVITIIINYSSAL